MNEISHEPILQQFPDAEWDEAASAVIVPLGQAHTMAEWLLGHGVDYCSNVTGVDYLEREVKEKITNDAGKVETVTRTEPARIDVVYSTRCKIKPAHWFSSNEPVETTPRRSRSHPCGVVAICRSERYLICSALILRAIRTSAAS